MDLYNRSGESRRIEAFALHMQIAWLYLLQARFERDGIDFYYRDSRGRRKKIDGDLMTWDLARCIKEVFPNQNIRCAGMSSSSSASATRSSTGTSSCSSP